MLASRASGRRGSGAGSGPSLTIRLCRCRGCRVRRVREPRADAASQNISAAKEQEIGGVSIMFTDAVLGHLVGDYILQNDWQASGKKRSSPICAVHCLLWTSSVCLFGWIANPWAIAWLFVSHFVIDRWGFIKWWMLHVGQGKFADPPMSPWSMIVVDNVFHLLTIWVAIKLAAGCQ
jgi:Protein of unknown function (DUF3307)